MNTQELIHTASTLVADDEGLLAMDESSPTCNKRFARLRIPQTEEARRLTGVACDHVRSLISAYRRVLCASRKGGGSARVTTTNASPVTVLMS
jgi:fructose-bisphosphate aldolase class 1